MSIHKNEKFLASDLLTRGRTLFFLIVILFTTRHILGLIASLGSLVEDTAERAASKVRPVGREGAGEEGSAVLRGPVQAVSGTNGAGEAVSDLLRALCLAARNHVGMCANTLQVVEDEGSGAGVDRPLASGAVEVLVALRQLEDAVLTRAAFRRLRVLQKLATFAVDSVRQDASDAVKDQAVVAQEGLGGCAGGQRASMKLKEKKLIRQEPNESAIRSYS